MVVPPLATGMMRIERTFGNLKQLEQVGWNAPKSDPDLNPMHESLMLREHFAELLRTKAVLTRPPDFRELIEHSRSEAESLEKALRKSSVIRSQRSRDRLSVTLSAIDDDCKRCHRDHRDEPSMRGNPKMSPERQSSQSATTSF